jgi:integrase
MGLQLDEGPADDQGRAARGFPARQADPHPGARGPALRKRRDRGGASGWQLVRYRGKWAVAIGRGTDRRRYSTGTDDVSLARVIAAQIVRKLNKPETDRVFDLWSTYLADRRADGKDVTRQEDAWKHLKAFFGERLGHDVDKDSCRQYAALRQRFGAASGTIRTELEYLRACLNLRYGRGHNRVWLPSGSPPRDRYLTREDVDRLLSKITTPHVRLFVILAITTGARMGAILELTWSQVDFKHRTINFNAPGHEQSNKRRAKVPINERAYQALEEAARAALTDYVIEWDGKQVKSIKKAIRMAAARSGVPCSPHVFRHTAGVWMAQADVPMQKISQFLGHTSTRVTERTYARYSPSFMKDAAAALEF